MLRQYATPGTKLCGGGKAHTSETQTYPPENSEGLSGFTSESPA
jgi:hypothetical protein